MAKTIEVWFCVDSAAEKIVDYVTFSAEEEWRCKTVRDLRFMIWDQLEGLFLALEVALGAY